MVCKKDNNIKKLAVFYITYNHPEVVDEVLSASISDYYERDIDLFYYEGSDCEDTKLIIDRYRDMGFSNLYYAHYPQTSVEDRVELIINDKTLIGRYEYIWFSKDRSYCDGRTLDKLLLETCDSPDAIMLGVFGNPEAYQHANPRLFYRDWGWLTSSLDVLIYKTSTILLDVDFSSYNYVFGGVTMLFEQLSKREECKVSVLSQGIRILNSARTISMWKNNIFKVWKDEWINAHLRLPDTFDEYKLSVIKQGASLPWLLGSKRKLYELYCDGILTVDNLSAVEQNWEMVSNVSIDDLRKIAEGRYDPLHDVSSLMVNNNYVSTLISIFKLIEEGKLRLNDIPIEDIELLALNYVDTLNYTSEERKLLIVGSVRDVLGEMKTDMLDKDHVLKQMQLLILLISQ